MAPFYTYNFSNVALIVAQQPEATEIAGYRTWQKLGRQQNRQLSLLRNPSERDSHAGV